MGMRRACSYRGTFRTPRPASEYSAMLLSIQQNGQNLINKTMDDLTPHENTVVFQLTQEETALLRAGVPALVQLRCYASAYDAPGSAAYAVDVYPALNDEILTAPAEVSS